MANHVYKPIELTNASTTTISDTVSNAIARRAKTMRHLHWFQAMATRVALKLETQRAIARATRVALAL